MKKFLIILLCAILALCLFGCGDANQPTQSATPGTVNTEPPTDPPTQAPTEPETFIGQDETLAGVDISGMKAEEALQAIKDGLEAYTITFTVNGQSFPLTAGELSLELDEEALLAYLTALEEGSPTENIVLATCNPQVLSDRVSSSLRKAPENAQVFYDTGLGSFTARMARNGSAPDTSALPQLVRDTVAVLSGNASARVGSYPVYASVVASDQKILDLIEEANTYLDLQISYTYETEGLAPVTVAIDTNTIAGFIGINNSNYTVYTNDLAIETYVSKMANTYHGPHTNGYFPTTSGSTAYYTVKYYGSQVDQEAMRQDLRGHVAAKESGTYTAPFNNDEAAKKLPYGGHYVEVDLTAQMVYVYKGGKQVLASSVVSGCVANGNWTPNGVYAVQEKDSNCYLIGTDYATFVYYWIGFYGGYGLHDATWRYYFGGDIYLYNGSHGCVNMPLNNAQALYNSVSVGTPVIVHGGLRAVDPLPQELTGTASYDVADDTVSFALDVTAKYPGGTMKYTSDNPEVVTVDGQGNVTVHGIGTAAITVTADVFEYYTSATFTVTVNVHSACEDGRHQVSVWEQTIAPTCKPGEESGICDVCEQPQTRTVDPVDEHIPGTWTQMTEPGCESEGKETTTCTVCGDPMERSVDATGHDFTTGSSHCDNGCGTENPDYQPSEPPSDETEQPSGDTEESTSGNPESVPGEENPEDPGKLPEDPEDPPAEEGGEE